jgi:pimeloyl-ACP methyl ester carboxylesterase
MRSTTCRLMAFALPTSGGAKDLRSSCCTGAPLTDGNGVVRSELSDEFAAVAWDAPGCGESSDPPGTFRGPDYADCLAAFINAVGLALFSHDVGYSHAANRESRRRPSGIAPRLPDLAPGSGARALEQHASSTFDYSAP